MILKTKNLNPFSGHIWPSTLSALQGLMCPVAEVGASSSLSTGRIWPCSELKLKLASGHIWPCSRVNVRGIYAPVAAVMIV